MQHTPSHFGICVSDLDRSLRFYCEGLGFEAAEGYDLDSEAAAGLDRALEIEVPVKIRSQFISNGEMRIELIGFREPAVVGEPSTRRNQLGITHLSFWVDDVDAAADRLVGFGATILPDTRANPGVELVFLTDPDGTRVELMQRV
jgi:catechol 2,3-dioxygenase-like lactoylglutathione lyase family enzyme